VPAEWLVPGRIVYVQTRVGSTTTPLGDGLARLVHLETLPEGKVVREETTYQLADLIPTLRVTAVDGVEVGRYEVVEFTLGTPSRRAG